MTFESRTASLWPVDMEVRAIGNDGFEFEGYAAKYNEPSLRMAFPNMNSGRPFREIIRPGAFSKTLAENPDLVLVVNHDMRGLPLARTNGTMTVSDDGVGLRVRAELPDDELGRPVRNAIKRGTMRGMSFRFNKVRDKWTPGTGGADTVRELVEARLDYEVSVAAFPAYPETEAAVRALADEVGVDPDALVAALGDLAPGTKITRDQRDLLIQTINTKSDAPVMDAATAERVARMRERIARAG